MKLLGGEASRIIETETLPSINRAFHMIMASRFDDPYLPKSECCNECRKLAEHLKEYLPKYIDLQISAVCDDSETKS